MGAITRTRSRCAVGVVLTVVVVVAGFSPAPAARAGWGITRAARGAIEGFARDVSVAPGGAIGFSVSSVEPRFDAEVFRLGWYGGEGARLMRRIAGLRAQRRRIPAPDRGTGLVVARWPETFRLPIPRSWPSGAYIVRLTDGQRRQTYMPFVVRGTGRAPIAFIRSVSTDQAYNSWGGTSLYRGATPALGLARAVAVSFDRPFLRNHGAGDVIKREAPMIRFLERERVRVDYLTDVDVHRDPAVLSRYRGIVIVGHSEYWSARVRDAFDDAVARGVDLAVFAANTAYWQVRYEPAGGRGDRVLVCYKDASLDPIKGPAATVRFRDPPVDRPESMLLGAMYAGRTHGPHTLTFTDPEGAGIGARPGMGVGGVIADEFDRIVPGAPAPDGLRVFGVSPLQTTTPVEEAANRPDRPPADVGMSTFYEAASGASVFNLGALGWGAALEALEPTAVVVTRNIVVTLAT